MERSPLYRLAEKVEATGWLDRPAEVLDRLAPEGMRQGPLRDALGGRWLGHSVHPLMTDFPLGAWMAASVLDLIPGRMHRHASPALIGFGLAAAVPTVVTGWSDWLAGDIRERRVGVVHAVVNSTAATLYGASLLARLRGRHGKGIALGIAGGLAATAGGYFGGHLSLARPLGLRNTRSILDGDAGDGEAGGDGAAAGARAEEAGIVDQQGAALSTVDLR